MANTADTAALRRVMQELHALHPPSEENAPAIVDHLRHITEIVAWGDQHDPAVFEAFMEFDVLGYIRDIMNPPIDLIHLQVFQTLGIWMETLRTPTSKWFLMSRNYINDIISCPDINFQHEEILGYFISLLKMLSLELSQDTILLFRNMLRDDFPLFTQAVKLHNHENAMVRIAVRNITLMTFRVREPTLENWLETVAGPAYFSTIMWTVGNLTFKLQAFIDQNDSDAAAGIVAEHLDSFQYIDDVMKAVQEGIRSVVRDKLVCNLLLPLHIGGLAGVSQDDAKKSISSGVALFILAQALSNIQDEKVVNTIVATLLNGVPDVGSDDSAQPGSSIKFEQPMALADALEQWSGFHPDPKTGQPTESPRRATATHDFSAHLNRKPSRLFAAGLLRDEDELAPAELTNTEADGEKQNALQEIPPEVDAVTSHQRELEHQSLPDHEHQTTDNEISYNLEAKASTSNHSQTTSATADQGFGDRCYRSLLQAIACNVDDSQALPALCFLEALLGNKQVAQDMLRLKGLTQPSPGTAVGCYNQALIQELLSIVQKATNVDARVRLITLTMAARLIHMLVTFPVQSPRHSPQMSSTRSRTSFKSSTGRSKSWQCILHADHQKTVSNAMAQSAMQLKDFLTVEVLKGGKAGREFVELFEAEQRRMQPLRLAQLLYNSTILCHPDQLHSPGIAFEMKLPSSESDRRLKSMQVFLLLRKLYLDMHMLSETGLPLDAPPTQISIRQSVPLNQGDVIPCNCIYEEGGQTVKARRFMLVDSWRLLFLDADSRNLSMGIVRFVADLSSIRCERALKDSRKLIIKVTERPRYAMSPDVPKTVLFTCQCIFDDNIRSLTASQYIDTGKTELQQRKLQRLQQFLGELSRLRALPQPDLALTNP
eukprot:m.169017 g.169017  ORF g.169017 m.169017 type:complete len:885 (+) comp16469_c0_seq2:147-2801(+)